jgi:predicted acetyltransferase
MLVHPDPALRASFLTALAEYRAEGRYLDLDPARLSDPDAFARWVDAVRRQALRDEPRPEHYRPTTVLWWVEGEEYLGRIALRHVLTARTAGEGGHVGYDVRPSARRRGHATAMLRAVLPWARRLGLPEVLVTCDRGNVASRRVIVAVGGEPLDPYNNELRFRVPTGTPYR